MNIVDMLKNNINTLYVKYIKNDEVFEEPIFYIAGAQTLPPPLPEEEEQIYIEQLSKEDNTIEKFKLLSKEEKIKELYSIVKSYSSFLEYQNISDYRDCVNNILGSDQSIEKITFFINMYDSINSKKAKNFFYSFKSQFLKALINFKKEKHKELEEYIYEKGDIIKSQYKKYTKLLKISNEELIDIADLLILTTNTLNISLDDAIEIYSEFSKYHENNVALGILFRTIEKIEEKSIQLDSVKQSIEEEKKRQLEIENKKREEERRKLEERKKLEEERKKLEEEEKKRKQELEAIKQGMIVIEDGSTQKMNEEIEELRKENIPKEKVILIVLNWYGKDTKNLGQKIKKERETLFFEKIKEIQQKTGCRVSLFMITDAGKEIALRRMKELQKKSKENGLSNAVEGAFGGYSSFKIDSQGNIQDLAIMSEKNKEKIMDIMDFILETTESRELIDASETNYLRYILAKNDKTITRDYLDDVINAFFKQKKIVKIQPIEFIGFVEANVSGVDILLDSQLEGIKGQLIEYYRAKYDVKAVKNINISEDGIDKFIDLKQMQIPLVPEEPEDK